MFGLTYEQEMVAILRGVGHVRTMRQLQKCLVEQMTARERRRYDRRLWAIRFLSGVAVLLTLYLGSGMLWRLGDSLWTAGLAVICLLFPSWAVYTFLYSWIDPFLPAWRECRVTTNEWTRQRNAAVREGREEREREKL